MDIQTQRLLEVQIEMIEKNLSTAYYRQDVKTTEQYHIEI